MSVLKDGKVYDEYLKQYINIGDKLEFDGNKEGKVVEIDELFYVLDVKGEYFRTHILREFPNVNKYKIKTV